MCFNLREVWKFSTQDGWKTRKARTDAMPHERSSMPVPPIEFSSIALADRNIRFRRELPLPDHIQRPTCLTAG